MGAALAFLPRALNCRLSPLICRDIFGLFPKKTHNRDAWSLGGGWIKVLEVYPGQVGKKHLTLHLLKLDILTVTLLSEGGSYLQEGSGKEKPQLSLQFSGQDWALYTKVIFQFWYDYLAFFSPQRQSFSV